MKTEHSKQGRRPVEPVLPVAAYVGGKRNLAGRLVERIEKIPHEVYAEPFVGMGGVFFRRRWAPKVEVMNDYSRDVATLFRVLQRHYVAFLEMMRFQLTARAEFERLTATDPDTLTDLERAARFLYLQRTAFGGKPSGQNFGVQVDRPASFDVTRLVPMLEDLHSRLTGVVIENLHYAAFIERYDRAGTLFYLDPPYLGSEKTYGRGLFEREDFARLAEQLERIKGRFILSLNDHPEIRATFSRFRIEGIKTTYSVAAKSTSTGVKELVITNLKKRR